ncbi:MAG: beta-ketoacyl-ACP synthase II [Thermodesulfovibrionales bacterium]|nr:beta-ketoacyl-ACP synthase II [Thermodesulfovibrionales bacterium]
MKRVVITGIGAVTPLANNFQDSWALVKKGIPGIDTITRFDASALKWTISGEVKEFDASLFLTKKEVLRLDSFVQYAVAAASMAMENAGLTKFEIDRAGVIIGSSRGGIITIEKELEKSFASRITHHTSRITPYLMPSTTISMAVSCVSQKLGIKGHCIGISNACASGANAIGEAYRLIKHGYAGLTIAGGAEAPICRLCIEGYGMSGALSRVNGRSASKPFDKFRDGFVISEGACILVLEEYKSAVKRNAKIYAEVIGYSNTTDAFHITRPDVQGEAHAMRAALDDAGISPEDVDYINAHGTSTPIGDKTEAQAIISVFGKNIPASSIKSMTGHMLAASGAFETACAAMSIKEGVIPPTINLTERDPDCDIHVVTEKKEADIKIAITNSFGFGGLNAVLVLKTTDNI